MPDLTIWKYQLKLEPRQSFPMPIKARILSLQVQSGVACLWALVDPTAELEDRTFFTYGTGHPAYGGRYVGTYLVEGGSLVWHVFEDNGQTARLEGPE